MMSDADRIHELEAECAILREQVEYGIAKYLSLTHVLSEQAAVHDRRRDLMRSSEARAAQHIANIVVVGKKLDGVRQELTARAEAAESRLAALVDAVTNPGDAPYEAATAAVEKIAHGVPAWVLAVAINAALDEIAGRATSGDARSLRENLGDSGVREAGDRRDGAK